jgi:hypothetical protein
MHIVTVATKNEGYFDCLLQSCKRYGAKLEVLGWGQKWQGFTMKFMLMKQYLEKLSDDDIVCFIDAYDVILLRSIDELEKQFVNSGKKIIVAKDDDNINVFLRLYFGACKNTSINSGTYIGYVKYLKSLLKTIHSNHNLKEEKDDQMILTKVCNETDDISIDVNRDFFIVTLNLHDKNIKIDNGKIMCGNHYPFILHAPANYDIDDVLINMGYDLSNIHKRIDKTAYYAILFYNKLGIIFGILLFVCFLFILYKYIMNKKKK